MNKFISICLLGSFVLIGCQKKHSSSGNPVNPTLGNPLVDVSGLWSGTITSPNDHTPKFFNLNLDMDGDKVKAGELVVINHQSVPETVPVTGEIVNSDTLQLVINYLNDDACGGQSKTIRVYAPLTLKENVLPFKFTEQCANAQPSPLQGGGSLKKPTYTIPTVAGDWHGSVTNQGLQTSTVNSTNFTQEGELVYGTINVSEEENGVEITSDRFLVGQVKAANSIVFIARNYDNATYAHINGTLSNNANHLEISFGEYSVYDGQPKGYYGSGQLDR